MDLVNTYYEKMKWYFLKGAWDMEQRRLGTASPIIYNIK
jgi:hypothetical protein